MHSKNFTKCSGPNPQCIAQGLFLDSPLQVEADFATAMKLYHGMELLTTQGLRSFHNFFTKENPEDKGMHKRIHVFIWQSCEKNETEYISFHQIKFNILV